MTYIIFIILYLATFVPAWYLLLKLIALATSRTHKNTFFTIIFLLYQFVLALPYLYLLLFGGEEVSHLVKNVAYTLMASGLFFSIARFYFASRVNQVLWYLYGLIYDGLRHFYPYQNLQDRMSKSINFTKSMTVLDLGAGSGNQTVLLAPKVGKLVAVDNSASMLDRLRKKLKKNNLRNVSVIKSDLLEYIKQEKSSTYDAITLVNVLYTVEDRTTFWKEIHRILKPKGVATITNSDKGGNFSIIKEHISHKGFLSLLRPSLVAVFVIDTLISEMAKTGHFSFIEEDLIKKETSVNGFAYEHIGRAYGDVNIVFTVTK